MLYNLNVLNCCNIVFDSQDVPERLLGSPAPSKDVKVRQPGLSQARTGKKPPCVEKRFKAFWLQVEVPSFPSPIEGGSAVAEISPAVEELRRRLTQAGGAVQRTLPDPESLVQEVLRMVGDQRRLAGSHLSEGVDLPADGTVQA